MKLKYIGILLVIFAASAHQALAQNERRFIREGVEFYENEQYVESEVEFRKALEKEPESFEGRFNLGDALFKQEKVDEAIEQFQALSNSTSDKEKLSDIHHNIGNGFFAKQELEKSIEAYKNALRNDPLDDESRYNLIVARKLLEEQEQEQEQEQEEEQEEEQEQEQQEQEQQEQEQEQQEQQEQEQQQSEGISKENAERILQSLDEDEKELQERLRKAQQQQQREVDKNW